MAEWPDLSVSCLQKQMSVWNNSTVFEELPAAIGDLVVVYEVLLVNPQTQWCYSYSYVLQKKISSCEKVLKAE
jgi:hypothetical protein